MKKDVKFAKSIHEGECVRMMDSMTQALVYSRPSSSNGSQSDLPWTISLSANDVHNLNSLVPLGGPGK